MTRPVQQPAPAVQGWLREGRRVVAGLLVEVKGSSPLDVGASMYIDDRGGIEGSITGGCVEGAVAAAAMEMLEAAKATPQLVTYGISDELAGTVGLMCGGIVHIFIHELRPDTHAAVLADLQSTIDHTPAGLVTLIDGPNAGAKLFVDEERQIGSLGGELLDRNAAREAQGLLTEGRSAMRDFGEDGASLGSGQRVYNAIQAEPPRMVVFGAID